MVARWDTTRNDKCPDCGQWETASHLNLCPDLDRTKLLHDMANSLGEWLDNNYTHPELAYWIPSLIKLQGTRRLSDVSLHSPAMARVSASQDLIPWKAFMEGKLSHKIFSLRAHSLTSSPSCLTTANWATQVISCILKILHVQWIFCNVSLHDARDGYLCLKKHSTVLSKIDRLL